MTSGNNRKVQLIMLHLIIMHFTNNDESQHIFDNVKLALKRLDTEYIDVLQVYMTRSGETRSPANDSIAASSI